MRFPLERPVVIRDVSRRPHALEWKSTLPLTEGAAGVEIAFPFR